MKTADVRFSDTSSVVAGPVDCNLIRWLNSDASIYKTLLTKAPFLAFCLLSSIDSRGTGFRIVLRRPNVRSNTLARELDELGGFTLGGGWGMLDTDDSV